MSRVSVGREAALLVIPKYLKNESVTNVTSPP